MPNYNWPPMAERKYLGKRISRIDGIDKATGRAKYNSDLNLDGLLFGALLTSPYAHARIRSIDIGPARAMPGVTAVIVIQEAGKEVNWQGQEIAAVAATSEELARDAVRAIKVDYEVLPHLVREEDLAKAGTRAKPAGEQVTGDPDKAFKEADAVHEGEYSVPVLTHCCLEPHGQVVAWGPNKIEYFPSTQNVSAIGPDLAGMLKVPATQIHVHQDHIGGGFGSKFPADLWGKVCAELSKASGGKPVKLFLERATELQIAGNRPSFFAKIKVAASKDGKMQAWQSQTWSTGGIGGGGVQAQLFPYLFTRVPNRRINHTAVSTNNGSARAWRAPNHPQVSFLTCAAMEDLAAKLNMSSLDFFLKNVDYTNKPDVYRAQLLKAAEMAEWKKLWHPRGDTTKGYLKRGMGIGVNFWGGLGHDAKAITKILPDGSVEIEIGSQDLGTGTRTTITQVAAESLGIPMNLIKLKLGDNDYPPAGASGGSTTIGGTSAAARKSAVNALQALFEKVAGSLDTTPENLEAVDGRIQVKGNPKRNLTWKAACAKLGVETISAQGENLSRNAMREGLINQGAAGVQIADVTVDIETGVVKMNRVVAVQDCGLVVNPKLAESQVYGAIIMNICGALLEERVMDEATGRFLNADMEFYKLAGISDIGEILVHMDITEEHDKRGIIGLGEPPTAGTLAAISNAVANAVGVRVPHLPLTPDRVLAALANRRNA